MMSRSLNILVAVALVLAGTTYRCGNCDVGSATCACCQGMESQNGSSPCGASLPGADRGLHRCADGSTVLGLVAERIVPASDSGPNYLVTAAFSPPLGLLTAAHKMAEVSREETSGGGVFLVLDGSSIPIAIGHLLF